MSDTFTAISGQINEELHSNQPRSVYDVMKDVSHTTGEDKEDEEEEKDAENHKLKQLINAIYSALNMRDLMEFFSLDFTNAYKVHESGRAWLCKNLGDPAGSDNIADEQLESFTEQYYADFTKIAKEEVPQEILARVKPGADLRKVAAEELKKHILTFLRLLMTPISEDHQVFANAFKHWVFTFVKGFVETIASVLVGGIDDVQVVLQYFVYNVNNNNNNIVNTK